MREDRPLRGARRRPAGRGARVGLAARPGHVRIRACLRARSAARERASAVGGPVEDPKGSARRSETIRGGQASSTMKPLRRCAGVSSFQGAKHGSRGPSGEGGRRARATRETR